MTTIPEVFFGEYSTSREAKDDINTELVGKKVAIKKGTEIPMQAFVAVAADSLTVWVKEDSGKLEPEPVKLGIQDVVPNEKRKTVNFNLVVEKKLIGGVELSNPAPGRYLIQISLGAVRALVDGMFDNIERSIREGFRKEALEVGVTLTEEELDGKLAGTKQEAHTDEFRDVVRLVGETNFTLAERFTTNTTVPTTTTKGDTSTSGVLPLAVGGGAALILLLMVK